jgi:hypothetical protein
LDSPEVTLNDSERARILRFFIDREEQLVEYNSLVAQVEQLKAKEGARMSEVNKLRERADGERIRLNVRSRRPKF